MHHCHLPFGEHSTHRQFLPVPIPPLLHGKNNVEKQHTLSGDVIFRTIAVSETVYPFNQSKLRQSSQSTGQHFLGNLI